MSNKPSIADEFTPKQPAPQEPDAQEDSPWGSIAGGLLFIGLGIGAYVYFGKLEAEGGSVRLPALLILAYEMIGRTGLMILLSLLGGVLLWAGVSDLRKSSGDEASSDQSAVGEID